MYYICIVTRGGIHDKICPEPKGNPEGEAREIFQWFRLYFIVFPVSSHYIDMLNYKSSIDIPGRSILEELILPIASIAGQYGKILPSRLRMLNSSLKLYFRNTLLQQTKPKTRKKFSNPHTILFL